MACCPCCCTQQNGVCCGTGEEKVCCKAPRDCCTVYTAGVGESDVCCTETQYCCNDGQGVCCEVGQICCVGDLGAVCCESNVVCCAGVCCAEGECCIDDACSPCECETDEDCPEDECCNGGVCGPCEEPPTCAQTAGSPQPAGTDCATVAGFNVYGGVNADTGEVWCLQTGCRPSSSLGTACCPADCVDDDPTSPCYEEAPP